MKTEPRILAIDDNPDNLIVFEAVVTSTLPGADFLAARNGPQGLNLAREHDPDVILLDILMPQMDGFEVCRQLKADERLQEIPVVFVTAVRADRASRARALEVGAEGFLSTPVDPFELAAQVQAMAKIKAANRARRLENERLASLVVERTSDLERQLAEKELLLRELYHRTKNNMQVIQAMLELGAIHSEDERVLRVFRQTENRIRAMALVHEKLYQSQHLSRLDLSDYVQSLAELLFDTYRLTSERVELVVEMEPVLTLIDIAVPCGLVVNELLSNALEHAFPDGRPGEIYISLQRVGPGELELFVRDDGMGLPEGFDSRASESFGLMAVHSIVEHQLQGQVAFSNGEGLTCRIRFRDDLYQERL